MDNRQQLIDTVRRSRKATKKLSKLLLATPLDADAITSCLDQGAIIEEAKCEVDAGRGSVRKINAVEAVLRCDRDDLISLFYKTPLLDKEARSSWLADAVSLGARQCCLALISLGAPQQATQEQRDEFLSRALWKGDAKVVELLLQQGSNPNAMEDAYSDLRVTLLHRAKNRACVEIMINAGARVDGVDTWGRPPLHRLLDRLASQTPDAETGPNLIDAAHVLLDAGSPMNSDPQTSSHRPWSAICALTRGDQSPDAGLMARVALADPEAARQADILNVWAAHHLLDSGVIEDMALFSRKIRFASFYPRRENERELIEYLLERGVKAPNLFSISFQEHRAWLDVGILVSKKDIEKKKMQEERDSEQEIFEDWSGLDDAVLVGKSNAKAQARQLRLTIDGAAASKIGGPRL